MIVMIVVVTGFVFFDIPIQVLLIIASAVPWISKRVGLTWQDLEKGIAERLKYCNAGILIILAVGIIVGSWMFFWDTSLYLLWLRFIESKGFNNAFFISAVTSVATGTAWGSASTAGIALISIGNQLGIPPGMAAGAIIAGAVFWR